MKYPDKWASTFPRLYELYCEDPSNPNNHFNSPNFQLVLQDDPPDPYYIELESILEELDSVAWQEWKGRAAHSLSVENRFGYPAPLVDAFNEARAYVFLKRQGYIGITFVKPGKKRAEKVPDLLAKDSEGHSILLEAKRIRVSDDEIAYFINQPPLDMRKVCHGLNDTLSDKLRSTVERARGQLLAFGDDKVRRRIVYLSIRIDSQSARPQTRDEIGKFLTNMSDGTIEIVHFIEN